MTRYADDLEKAADSIRHFTERQTAARKAREAAEKTEREANNLVAQAWNVLHGLLQIGPPDSGE